MSILPDLSNIGSLMMDVLVLAIMYVLFELKAVLLRWLQAHTTAEQRDTLHKLGEESVAFAKTAYAEHDGPAKLAAAMDYLSSRLRAQGINVTPEEMRAAIEKAYLAYKSATTQPAAPDQPVQIKEVPVPTPLTPEMQQLIAAAHAMVAAASNGNAQS